MAILTLWLIVSGGAILAKYYGYETEIPIWKFGQFSLLIGVIYFGLILALWWLLARSKGRRM